MVDNPNEWFDVVDATDRVTGRARRREVHAKGLLHRAVHVLVQRENGDIFLQKRSMEKDSNPGRWDSSCSGHLDSGETYDEAAIRELGEELGIEVEALTPSGCLPASKKTDWEFVRLYRAKHEGPFVLHPGEISDGRWVGVRDLNEWLSRKPEEFASCFHEVWQAVRGYFDGD